jgi:hypothetical protein
LALLHRVGSPVLTKGCVQLKLTPFRVLNFLFQWPDPVCSIHVRQASSLDVALDWRYGSSGRAPRHCLITAHSGWGASRVPLGGGRVIYFPLLQLCLHGVMWEQPNWPP